MRTKKIFVLLISILCLLTLSPNLEAKGRNIDITITPDKAEDYVIGEKATFDIEMFRHNHPANIKLKQIETTFPNEESPVSLTKVSKGKFSYITEEFEETGEKTLSLTVRSYGAVKSVEKLERLKERLERRIEWLEEKKENTNNERLKRIIDRLIARYQRIIQKIEAKIEKIREKGIIGEASCVITVILAVTPPPTGEDAGYIHGKVYDSSNDEPLAGAKITARDVEGAVLTDENGKFIFPIIDYPQENKKQAILTIEKTGYTYAQRRVVVTTTRDTSVDPAYLTQLDSKTTLITSAGGIATNADGTIEITFPEGATSEDIEVNATNFKRGKDLPAPLPETSFFTYALELLPDGATFDTPVAVKMANWRGFAAGTPIPVGYYNKNTVRWEVESMGVISQDGQWVEFEVEHFSPRDTNYPARAPSGSKGPGSDKIENKEDAGQTETERDPGVGIRSGSLLLEHTLPAIKSLGKSQELTFTYFSTSAHPSIFIGTETMSTHFHSPIPETSGCTLEIEGSHREVKFEGVEANKIRQAYLFAGENARGLSLDTGSYNYYLRLSNDYKAEYFTAPWFAGPPEEPTGIYTDELKSLTSPVVGRIIINNQQASPFGAGWTLNELQRLHFDPDGSVLLTQGNGSTSVFAPKGYANSTPFTSDIPNPGLLTIDTKDNLYVPSCGGGGDTIYKITPDGTKSVYSDISSTAVAFDLVGNLYASGDDGKVYKITPDGEEGIFADGFNCPQGLAFDREGVLYVADSVSLGESNIYKVTSKGKEIFISGLGFLGGLAFDNQGNLYVADFDSDAGNRIVLKITPDGEMATFVNWFGSFPNGFTFDAEGNLYITNGGAISIVNPEGEVKTFASGFSLLTGIVFDSLGNLYVSDAGAGAIYKISPNKDTIKSYTSPVGDFSKLTRNPVDSAYTCTMKDGTKMNFNSEGLYTSTVDRNGNATTYTYADVNGDDKAEELISIVDPTGGVTNLTYNNGYLTSVTDLAGRITLFNIDADGNLVSITTPDGAVTQYTYDENHLINNVTDALNNTTQYPHNLQGRYNQIIFPTDETINFIPSETQGLINDIPEGTGTPENPADPVPADIPDLLTNRRGFTTTYQTNKFGMFTKETDSIGRITKTERDSDSNPVRITRANGSVVRMSYDERGNLLTLTEEATDAMTTFTYELNFNQVTSITDPLGNISTMDYDAKGNPIKITDAQDNETTMTYDTKGLLTSTTDAKGNTTLFTYDVKGNLITTTDALGNITTFIYDTSGNVLSVTDAKDNTTTYEYDDMNRLLKLTDSQSNITSYEYDLNGNLVSITDANNNTTTFEYNEVNLLTKTTNPSGDSKTFTYDPNRNLATTTDAKGNTITYTYDEADQIIQKVLPDDSVNYSYNDMGNLVLVSDNDSSDSFVYDLTSRLTSATSNLNKTISYTYDKNSNRLAMADPTGTSGYVYGTLNRLTSITNPNAQTTTFNYDELSRRISMTLPNGIITNYGYDDASQLTSIQSLVASYQYTYDKLGNRTSMTEPAGVNNYAYDVLNRLADAIHPQPVNPAETFSYDTVGNRLSSHISTSYNYDDTNRLLEDNQYTYAYDNNGNMISKTDKITLATTAYIYNAENQLIRINFSDGTYAEYKYDGLGRRIQKNVNGNVTKYVYDGEDILLEYDGANTLTARYTHGTGIDEPLIMDRGGQSYFYHVDGLGSITVLTDASGNVLQTYIYDSFGNIVAQVGIIQNPYTYTGREYDAESKLYYYRARYYDAKIGRFLQEDPIGYYGSMNLYAYCANNSVNFVDPDGLDVYRVNRKIGGSGSRSKYNPVSHTFVVVQHKDGTITTYGWGTTYNDQKQGLWGTNGEWDQIAASEAIDKGKVKKIGGSDLDLYAKLAYEEIAKDPTSFHRWWLWNNCKHEAYDLIRRAKRLQESDRGESHDKCK